MNQTENSLSWISQWSVNCPYKQGHCSFPITMSEVEWINVAGKSLLYCAELLEKIKRLKELLDNTQEELTRLKTVVNELQEQNVYDTVH